MELDPDEMSASEVYRILSGAITPRPIAFVSSESPDGEPNLAPFSFFNGVSANPPLIMFSPLTIGGEDRDTLRNVLPKDEGGIGEFVVNLVSEDIVRRMSATAEGLAYGDSEWALVDLTPAPSTRVKPARVLESPLAFECRTWKVIRTNPGESMSGNIVFGRVVHIAVQQEGLLDEKLRVDPNVLRTVGRLGGPAYTRTVDGFPLVRGRPALEAPLPFANAEAPATSDPEDG